MILGQQPTEEKRSARTVAREAFFLEFARAIRSEFPDTPLMVTGGFRTRTGVEAAVASGDCELVGIARPAVMNPALPSNTLFNPEISDADATLFAVKIEPPWLAKKLGIMGIGAGFESVSQQAQKTPPPPPPHTDTFTRLPLKCLNLADMFVGRCGIMAK